MLPMALWTSVFICWQDTMMMSQAVPVVQLPHNLRLILHRQNQGQVNPPIPVVLYLHNPVTIQVQVAPVKALVV